MCASMLLEKPIPPSSKSASRTFAIHRMHMYNNPSKFLHAFVHAYASPPRPLAAFVCKHFFRVAHLSPLADFATDLSRQLELHRLHG
jgi:hypothetical protein